MAVSEAAINFLNTLDDAQLNLVSVFGGAGTGKSTLMNHLTGQSGLFEVGHDLSKPCTRGVDMSVRPRPVVARVDARHALTRFAVRCQTTVFPWEVLDTPHIPECMRGQVQPSPSGINVGFVDAEGQGDRDTKYDTMLFAPVILVSKAVILNIREGRLQKNSILEKLDVLQVGFSVVVVVSAAGCRGSGCRCVAEEGDDRGKLACTDRRQQAAHRRRKRRRAT